MSLYEWGFNFDGPYYSADQVPNIPGVYTVWCQKGNTSTLIDVGQAKDLRERLSNHERKSCWLRHCSGVIYFYTVNISSEPHRLELELLIRYQKKPPCGKI